MGAEEEMEVPGEQPFTTVASKKRYHLSVQEMTNAASAAARRPTTTATAPPAIATKNRYTPLSAVAEQPAASSAPPASTPKPRRPPAIQVYGITNVRAFARDLGAAVRSKDVTVRRLGPSAARKDQGETARGDTCRVMLASPEGFAAAKDFFAKQEVAYSTWAEKKDRLTAYVIEGLSSGTSEDEIFADLQDIGIPVRKVRQLRMRDGEKIALFSFTAPSTPEWPVTRILALRALSYCRVSVRRFHHDAPQMCHRCSRFGHSSEHCHAVPRCFRCAGPHTIQHCQRTREDTPTCCNCGGPHAAISRSCPQWRQARARRQAPAPAPTSTPAPLPKPLLAAPPKRNAWGGAALSFVPPQVQRAAPTRKLGAAIPQQSAYIGLIGQFRSIIASLTAYNGP